MSPILQEDRVKQNRVRELWKQGKPAVQGWCSTGNPYAVPGTRCFGAICEDGLKTLPEFGNDDADVDYGHCGSPRKVFRRRSDLSTGAAAEG